jgi:hypothetical protein
VLCLDWTWYEIKQATEFHILIHQGLHSLPYWTWLSPNGKVTLRVQDEIAWIHQDYENQSNQFWL